MQHSPPFALFGHGHLTAIILTVAVPLVLAVLARGTRSDGFTRAIRWLFAAELIATYILWYWIIFSNGWQSAQTLLPMWLCDWATITAIVTLIWPNQRTYELAYFWALAGTLQAMITPDLRYDFPDLRFVVFFAFHGGVIAAVLFLTLGARMRPYPASIARVLAWSFIYLLAAGAVDWQFNVNFGYLRSKPPLGSLMDVLGPWPWYIASLAGLAIVFVLVLYLPFWIADRIRPPMSKAKPGAA